jgi:hypothetical protein
MRRDRLSVKLNGKQLLNYAQFPGIPSRGRVALQHRGANDTQGNCRSPPALVQFRNIAIKTLNQLVNAFTAVVGRTKSVSSFAFVAPHIRIC